MAIDGSLAAEAAAKVYGTVSKVKSGRPWGYPGEIEISFAGLETVSGQAFPVAGMLRKREREPNFFVRYALLGVLMKGKTAILEAGTKFRLPVGGEGAADAQSANWDTNVNL